MSGNFFYSVQICGIKSLFQFRFLSFFSNFSTNHKP
ncbi:hypothetical protein BVRB_3g055370 [Beta vulgaris subsp. vulgaris]|nr:hypothetical protein BVRB_3g055370 [Beta vulgaris subsp. vulgaris]